MSEDSPEIVEAGLSGSRQDKQKKQDEQRALVGRLVEAAQAEGRELVGPGGMLAGLVKLVLETALQGEMDAHLGRGHGEITDPGETVNHRNGARPKTVVTDVGPVEIQVPRDRDASFEPKIVRKRQRRLGGVDDMVLSLSAKGLTHGEISAHLAEIYGTEVSKATITTITDRVLEGMTEWQNRPLDPVYAVLFIDAIHVKIRDGKVANRPIYLVIGVTADGFRDILGIWAGDGGEGAKFRAHVLTELKNRGVGDVLMAVCDGLKGLPEAINGTWPQTVVQVCIVHLLRNTFRYVPRQHWPKLAEALRPVYTAPTEAAALERWCEVAETWGGRYPAIVRLWDNAWSEFVPFLAFDVEIRKVICSTNAIESVNARIRRAVRARGHFPNEQAALKCVYLALMSLDPTGTGQARWGRRWKAALGAFDLAFDGRLTRNHH
ncbi:IS256 family transposase [Actinocorallia aurea]